MSPDVWIVLAIVAISIALVAGTYYVYQDVEKRRQARIRQMKERQRKLEELRREAETRRLNEIAKNIDHWGE